MTLPTTTRPNVWPIGTLCLIATIALGFSAQTLAAPLIIGLLLGSYLLLGAPTLPKPRSLLAFLTAVPFALWYRQLGDVIQTNEYVPVTLLYIVGLYMMALAAHHVMAIGKGGSRDYALACAIMGMGMAGTARRNPAYLPLLVVFLPILLWHIRVELLSVHGWNWRRAPWVRLTLVMAVLMITTVLMHLYVVKQIPVVNRWAVRKLMHSVNRSSVGFDRATDLKSVLDVWGDAGNPAEQEVAVRVFADKLPDPYLRGAVYDDYRDGVWRLVEDDRNLQPTGTYLGRNVFDTRSESSGQFAGMIYADRMYNQAFFLPMNVHRLTSFADSARYGRAYTVRPGRSGSGGGYGFFNSDVQMPAPGASEKHLARDLAEPLKELAHSVMDPHDTPQRNILRLTKWFSENFEYQRGMKRLTSKDPVLEFLEDRRKGHCEFFATAAALMLRTVKIPTRYVTGFVADEEGLGDVWIARRKDAHAWVEAYLGPDVGWTLVEATPASARPATAPVEGFSRYTQWVRNQWDRLMQIFLSGGFMAMLGALWDMLVSLLQRIPIWTWLVFIGAGVAWVFRANIRAYLGGGHDAHQPHRVLALQRQLADAEKLLARHGLRRPPSMTVGRYLARLREADHIPQQVRQQAEPLLVEYQTHRFRRPAD
ncbi:transglutaminase domain-containing protein [Planctomycetales bacterium ZRK34]|nr:transglutaminase domain-containing protein [Planctomycetales bacterium ZRK34]